ncbi:MAG: iron ABC transporter permease [Candidatus Thiodiazotropha taylori]|nr:iron ABC transporter permease [Candidatus Thiodiazotropha taylori]MCG7961857.1 iron ABC transporter permease [Candidatus Thiodiazotropha endolucinida]RLW69312.1 MAG: iron ABC transporter permease [gamma proteobacterium symbiont of Stewartia floridana]MCG7967667.1 iron ABC transporter permease [Candidatus Thiodiazotropha taylori]MCG8042931.1 iron ABC transporter permease [Candidatus Thiodiazotropha taylori]
MQLVSDKRLLSRLPFHTNGWSLGVIGIALLLAVPVLVVLGYLFEPAGEVWEHLAATVLQDYVINSLLLMIGVAIGVLLLGVSTAWLTSMCQFPGRWLFEWALLLPMAIPAYIIAYTYTGLFDFAGPVQTLLRELTGWGYGDYWFPEIRSIEGAALMLALVLYPYVYLLSRAAFMGQSICVLDVSRTLGNGPWRTFFMVALPLARPAIVAGLSLALMETLADYGTVQYFGVSTFTTGIFRTWYGLNNAAAAAQLSAMLLLVVFTLILIEKGSRRQARYHHTTQRHQSLTRFQLTRLQSFMAFMICFGALFFGFLLPAGQLLWWALTTAEESLDGRFLSLITHSLALAASASGLALLLALFLSYGKRQYGSWPVVLAVRTAGMGYAIPGTVIAIGVMIPFAAFDNALDDWMRAQFGWSTGLLLSGTLVALIFAYLVRFLAVSLQTVEAGLGKIRPTMDEVALSMGVGSREIIHRVHMPMLKGSLMTALLLVFVDVLKELPATLILRPFNYNTLAVRAYELASDERLADASYASLTIVAVGILPVILLSRSITRSRHAEPT